MYETIGGPPHADWYNEATDTVDVFRKEILKEFTKRFQGMQISLLWAIFLDPRLVSMNGFSAAERNGAKQMLMEKMKDVPVVNVVQNTSRGDILVQEDDEDDLYGNTLLGDIFATSDGGDAVQQHEYSHEIEVEKYFSLCIQSKPRDPTKWWNIHRQTFPVLAWLARKWLSAVSTSVSSERLFSRTVATVTARRAKLNDDHVEMLTCVHDNFKYAF